jgi:hypothetical protein
MRSPSRLLARIEALELALAPKGRLFVFTDDDGAASSFEGRLATSSFEERLASFRAENGVGPRDEVLSVRITYGAE